jgi:thioredoxin reductase
MSAHDVVIVGAGPAGLAAAGRLRDAGISDMVVLEREDAAGGVPRHCGHRVFGLHEFHRLMKGDGYARRLVADSAGIDVRTETAVTALHPGGELELSGPDGSARLEARYVLLATGIRETPRPARLVSGTRPWGVTTTGALQRFVNLAGMRPFERAVIVGTEWVSFSALSTLRRGGMEAVAMIEENRRITARRPADLVARWGFGVPVLMATRLVRILGRERVEGVELERGGRRWRLDCDGVVFSGSFVPEAALLGGGHPVRDPGTGGPVIDQYFRCSDPAFLAAGNLLRPVEPAVTAYREGIAAAETILAALQGRLTNPIERIDVAFSAPIRSVCPQVVARPGRPAALTVRMAREARGRLRLVIDGETTWSRRLHALPERRIHLPAITTDTAHTLAVVFDER